MPLSSKAAQLCIRSRSCPRQFGANQVSRRRPSTSHVYLRLIEMLSWPTSCHHPIPHPVRCPLCATRLAHNSQLNRKVKMSLIASIYLNEFSLAECRACYKFPVLPFIASALLLLLVVATAAARSTNSNNACPDTPRTIRCDIRWEQQQRHQLKE